MARDLKPKGEKDSPEVFAAVPPQEAKMLWFRKVAAEERWAMAAAAVGPPESEAQERGGGLH